ncbi:hypothetical protein YPPY14_3172, partial [Yersinia pestis PY-14]
MQKQMYVIILYVLFTDARQMSKNLP